MSFKLFLTTDNLNYVREETVTLSEPATTRIASFKTPSGRWGYEYRTHYGHDRHVHDDDYVYTLPYAPGSTYTVSQNHANLLTHHDGNRYAIDWSMPIGDPVHAARGGIVVSTYQLAGSERVEASATANHIWIQHSDGTIGKYLHLDHDGVLVEEGEIVSPGQHIGSSGNTGFSSGPHLHFSVSTLDGENLYQSFNVRFKTSVGPGYIDGEGPYLHSQ